MNAPTDSPVFVVCLKAFGDLVIARNSLRATGTEGVGLLLGDHLVELNQVLGTLPVTHVVEHGEGGVPSMFDVRRSGGFRAVASARKIRKLVKRLALPKRSALLFDRVGPRELFIASNRPSFALPQAENIYQAYTRVLCPRWDECGRRATVPRTVRNLGIFPNSRVRRKEIPAAIIQEIVNTSVSNHVEPTVYLLDGEDIGPLHSVPIVKVPRRFQAMADAVKSSDSIVTADSMPGHLAEYFNVPSFVMVAEANRYWLPHSSFIHDRWAIFSDSRGMQLGLTEFLSGSAGYKLRYGI